MRYFIVVILLISGLTKAIACSCPTPINDSFSLTVDRSDFVALVKIVSFDDFLEIDITDHEGPIPYSMTAEVVKIYKGNTTGKFIKIYGDNGILCRPYLSEFELNKFYLVAPHALSELNTTEFDFSACITDYLEFDDKAEVAYGNYSMLRNEISLSTFENKMKYGDWDLGVFACLILTLGLLIFRFKARWRGDLDERKTAQLKVLHRVLQIFIALVWLMNGLYCKVLGMVPRHERIIGVILNKEYKVEATLIIGILEIMMAIWILSGFKSRINAILQITLVGTMNVLEFIVVPELLLWGKLNIVFAALLMLIIYYNEFVLHRKLRTSTGI